MNIVILGADGQLGRDLQVALSSYHVVPLDVEQIDIVDGVKLTETVARKRPQWIINCAAMTDVDGCESDDIRAFEVNALGAHNTALCANKTGAKLIHMSTDYVFDGSKGTPYVETDPPRPLNAYGISKLAGELYVQSAHAEHYVIRTSGLYGLHACRGKGGRNFVDTMLHLAAERDTLSVVSDEVLTPTFTEDLAAQILALVERQPEYGIYHATNGGHCSWFEFAREVFKLAGVEVTVEQTTAAEWNAPAKRPRYSVLENSALQRLGINLMPPWKDALKRYLAKKLAAKP